MKIDSSSCYIVYLIYFFPLFTSRSFPSHPSLILSTITISLIRHFLKIFPLSWLFAWNFLPLWLLVVSFFLQQTVFHALLFVVPTKVTILLATSPTVQFCCRISIAHGSIKQLYSTQFSPLWKPTRALRNTTRHHVGAIGNFQDTFGDSRTFRL